METTSVEKKSKLGNRPSNTSTIRVRKDTRKKILQELAKINKKDFGKRVRPDAFIALAVSLVQTEHVVKLQEESLSHADRFERDFRSYIAQHGPISKDEYLGIRLSQSTEAKK